MYANLKFRFHFPDRINKRKCQEKFLPSTGYIPDTSVHRGRGSGQFVVHGSVLVVLKLGLLAVAVERAVVGRGLGRGVDGARPLVGGRAQAG